MMNALVLPWSRQQSHEINLEALAPCSSSSALGPFHLTASTNTHHAPDKKLAQLWSFSRCPTQDQSLVVCGTIQAHTWAHSCFPWRDYRLNRQRRQEVVAFPDKNLRQGDLVACLRLDRKFVEEAGAEPMLSKSLPSTLPRIWSSWSFGLPLPDAKAVAANNYSLKFQVGNIQLWCREILNEIQTNCQGQKHLLHPIIGLAFPAPS